MQPDLTFDRHTSQRWPGESGTRLVGRSTDREPPRWTRRFSIVEMCVLAVVAAAWAVLEWTAGIVLMLAAVLALPVLLILGIVTLALAIQFVGVLLGVP